MCHSLWVSHLTNSDSSFKALLFRRVSSPPQKNKKIKGATASSRAPLLCERKCLSAGGKGARFIKTSSFLQLNYQEGTLACTRACTRVFRCVSHSNTARGALYKVTPGLLWKRSEPKGRARKEQRWEEERTSKKGRNHGSLLYHHPDKRCHRLSINMAIRVELLDI